MRHIVRVATGASGARIPDLVERCRTDDVDLLTRPLWELLGHAAGFTVSVVDDRTAQVSVSNELSLAVRTGDGIEGVDWRE